MERCYTLDSRVQYWLLVAGGPIFLLVWSAGAVWIWVRNGEPIDPVKLAFFAVWLGALVWGTVRQSAMPHTIELTDTGMIRFVGTFRTSEVAPTNILSVKARSTFAVINHTGGKIQLLQQFTGFHDFLSELKRMNPNVEFRGV